MSKAITSQDFEEKVLKNSKPVLVDFWASWCPPCRALAPIIEEVSEELKSTADVYKLDVDANQDIAGKYGIVSIPTVMVFKDGKPVQSIVGLRQKRDYIAALK